MSFLTLQYGQCGNQLGEALFATVFEDIKNENATNYHRNSLNSWFDMKPSGKLSARSISVDTETKVVNSRRPSSYDFKNVIAAPYGGSANNWAFGYNYQSNMLIDPVLDAVRQEIEKSDCSVTFLNLLSSSGGTGSGVGSRIIEELRSNYSNKIMINGVVLPYINGEIITQNYNTILSLARLQIMSDTLILFENDKLHELCSNKTSEKINFTNINNEIAFQLATTLQPIADINNAFTLSRLTPHPLYKYLQLKSAFLNCQYRKFETNQTWKTILNSSMKLSKYDQNNSTYQINKKTIATTVLSRGKDKPKNEDFNSMKLDKHFVSWIPNNERFVHHHETRPFCGRDRTLTVVTNDNNICYFLNAVLDDAWTLFTKKAYLHHYEKYGVGEGEFQEAFQIMENVLGGYQCL